MGVEAAQAGGELGRKHVHGALGKVDRGAALVRFAIERAALLHVMRDIGNVNAEPVVTVRQPADGDGIVEVAGVLAVNRHGGQIAEVGAPAEIALGDRPAQPDGFGDGVPRMRVGNAVLADDDFGVDAGCIDVAEHLGDAPDGSARGGRPPCQLDHHHLAGRGAALLAGWDEDVHQDAPIERHDVPHAALVAVVAADDPLVAALEDADDASFGASAFLDSLDPHHHPIAVHRLVQVRSGDVDVAAAVERALRCNKPVAGRVRLQASHVEIHLLRQTVAVTANLDQIAGRDQRAHVALERGALLFRDLEDLNELAHSGRVVHALAQQREHLIAGKH